MLQDKLCSKRNYVTCLSFSWLIIETKSLCAVQNSLDGRCLFLKNGCKTFSTWKVWPTETWMMEFLPQIACLIWSENFPCLWLRISVLWPADHSYHNVMCVLVLAPPLQRCERSAWNDTWLFVTFQKPLILANSGPAVWLRSVLICWSEKWSS